MASKWAWYEDIESGLREMMMLAAIKMRSSDYYFISQNILSFIQLS